MVERESNSNIKGTSQRRPITPPAITPEELTEALTSFAATGVSLGLNDLQRRDPRCFAQLAVARLASPEPSDGLSALASLVASEDSVFSLLLSEDVPLPEASAATLQITVADPNFDRRMVHKLLSACETANEVPAPLAVRLMEILDNGSAHARLASLFVRFVNHPSPQVRSKCVLLLGRGNLNRSRTNQFLSSTDARVRANAVESIWGHEGAETEKILLQCLLDPSPRVRVNALVGLCRLGDQNAPAQLLGLAGSENPILRAGSAWGMGQVSRPDVAAQFRPMLESMTRDPHHQVQALARKSLERLASPPVAMV